MNVVWLFNVHNYECATLSKRRIFKKPNRNQELFIKTCTISTQLQIQNLKLRLLNPKLSVNLPKLPLLDATHATVNYILVICNSWFVSHCHAQQMFNKSSIHVCNGVEEYKS